MPLRGAYCIAHTLHLYRLAAALCRDHHPEDIFGANDVRIVTVIPYDDKSTVRMPVNDTVQNVLPVSFEKHYIKVFQAFGVAFFTRIASVIAWKSGRILTPQTVKNIFPVRSGSVSYFTGVIRSAALLL